jgi:flagellin-like hook-associated protein FlgL
MSIDGLLDTAGTDYALTNDEKSSVTDKFYVGPLVSPPEIQAYDFASLNKFVKAAQLVVSAQRSQLGSVQNRLEHTIANLDNIVENTTAAEAAIRDTDMATEMVRYSNNNILQQAGQAMLAQSNQSNQGVLSLLQ